MSVIKTSIEKPHTQELKIDEKVRNGGQTRSAIMTGKEQPLATPNPYLHSVDFSGRPPPPTEGYSWEHIKNAIDTSSLHVLRRTDKGQYEYEQWQNQIDRTKYKNAGEYIAFTLLNWPDLKDPADATNAMTENLSMQERYKAIGPRLSLRLNHYPVPVQKSIQYFVLWSSRDMSLPSERERLDEYLKLQLGIPGVLGLATDLLPPAPGKRKQWIWFVNPIELRSVASVHHLHVFVRDIPE